MAAKNIAVFGVYRDRASFEYALCALKAAGIRDTDISALTQHNPESSDVANVKAAKTSGGSSVNGSGTIIESKLGLLPGTSQFVVPGLGSLLVAGPLVESLSETADGGTTKALTTALRALGIPEYEARRHEREIKSGGILLSVHCDDPDCLNMARKSLSSTGAENVSSTDGSFAD